MSTYALSDFVSDLRTLATETGDPAATAEKVVPLAQRLVAENDWSDPMYREAGQDQGFGICVLSAEPDDTLFVETICWLPGRGVAPHDHQTWGVVVGIDGDEINLNWTRNDDGSKPGFADLSVASEVTVGPGEAATFMPDDIHSVRNDGPSPTVSLHVYGKVLSTLERSEFDPIIQVQRPCPQRIRRQAG
jgi:predicted metal-dependent enzyme (double-stranded beta helix superfamily)